MSSYKAPARTVGRLERPFGNLYYEVSGSGPALLFAHGLGGNHLSWWQQVAHFAPHYTCVTFAHRGFAPSDAVPGGPDAADYAGDLAALIDHLKFSDVRLVAQSMGGWTMLEYAIANPGKGQGAGPELDIRHARSPRLRSVGRRQVRCLARRTPKRKSRRALANGIHPAMGAPAAARSPALHLLYQQHRRHGGHARQGEGARRPAPRRQTHRSPTSRISACRRC